LSKGNWTREQEAAIRTRNCNLLVSAAAGAGKTAVLVERIVRRILDEKNPVDVDRLLVVTFTNAAAGEMKERIGAALRERLKENPGERRLQRQLLLLGKASISTLHSFCLELVRQNYYHLKLPEGIALDPRFRIADEIEGVLLKSEVLEDFLEEKYALGEPAFLALVEALGGERDDQALQDLVLKLYDFSRSQADPSAWLQGVAANFRAEHEHRIEPLFGRLAQSIAVALEEAIDLLDLAQRIARQPGGPAAYLPVLEAEKDQLTALLALCQQDWEKAFAELSQFSFGALKACRAEVDEFLKQQVQGFRNQAKGIIKSLQEEYLSRSPAELVRDMQEMAPLMECLCFMVVEFSLRYLKEKLARNLLDFNDLEHFALQLLREKAEQTGGEKGPEAEAEWVPSELAWRLREKYEEVLVDEYQDINGVQEAVLAMVSRTDSETPNLFMVGDVKQSIYGFRLAEPGLFMHKYESYSEKEGARERKIMLAKNFRSRQNIVDGVNFVFRQLMVPGLGGINYGREHELVFGADFLPEEELVDPRKPDGTENTGAAKMSAETENSGTEENGAAENGGTGAFEQPRRPLEFILIERDDTTGLLDETGAAASRDDDKHGSGRELNGEEPEEEEELDAVQAEARIIGRRILALQKEMRIWDKESQTFRAPQFRDMVILLRSIKATAPVFLDEFRKLGIPLYAETGSGYFAAQEIQLMLSLLRVIDNPNQDIPLAAVLLSPVVGLTVEDLARIRLCSKDNLFHALRLAARVEKGALKEKLGTFLCGLRNWRTFARRKSLVELIWLLYRETGYYDYAGAMPEGKQRQANLRALLDRAKQFEDTTMKGLFKFLRFLERLEKAESDLGTARALGENEDVVRLMSIHKSKGLEFPVVFVGGLGRKFNLREIQGDVLLDKDLGIGPVWVDPALRLKYPTLAKLVVREKLKEEMLAEEVRILYVAMTRAREALILVGSARNLPQQVKKWSQSLAGRSWGLSKAVLNQARGPLDWLGPCLLRHRAAKALRQAAGSPDTGWEVTEKDPAPWRIVLEGVRQVQAEEKEASVDYREELAVVRRLEPVESSPGVQDAFLQATHDFIEQRLSWEYPYRILADIPTKLTVTEIKNRFQYLSGRQEDSEPLLPLRRFAQRPRFLQEKGLLASEKGAALHLVMRHLDLPNALAPEKVEAQLAEMVQREILSTQQAESIRVNEIVRFLQSPLGERMLQSKELQRELSFTMSLPTRELYGEAGGIAGETIILQGTIDCLFEEDGAFVLLDYKTDAVKAGEEEILKERYKIQLDLYARAVETIFGRPVKEKLIYSFALQQALVLE